jgi:hypothetical protein
MSTASLQVPQKADTNYLVAGDIQQAIKHLVLAHHHSSKQREKRFLMAQINRISKEWYKHD